MIVSYLDQLERAAAARDVDLAEAFVEAGIGRSALLRARGGGDLMLTTARTVMAAIEIIGDRNTAQPGNADAAA